MAFGVLKRVTGLDLISDLSEFFQAFSGMVDGFRERAKRVSELLGDPATTFVVVCGPQGEPITEAVYFHRKLVEAQLPVGGVIVNKVHYETEANLTSGEVQADLSELLDEDLAERVARNFADYQALAERDARNVEHLRRELQPKAVIRIPYLDEDVHDLEALLKIDRYLFASEEQREALAASGASGLGALRPLALVSELADFPVGRVGDREEVADAVRGRLAFGVVLLLAPRARERRPFRLAVSGREPIRATPEVGWRGRSAMVALGPIRSGSSTSSTMILVVGCRSSPPLRTDKSVISFVSDVVWVSVCSSTSGRCTSISAVPRWASEIAERSSASPGVGSGSRHSAVSWIPGVSTCMAERPSESRISSAATRRSPPSWPVAMPFSRRRRSSSTSAITSSGEAPATGL